MNIEFSGFPDECRFGEVLFRHDPYEDRDFVVYKIPGIQHLFGRIEIDSSTRKILQENPKAILYCFHKLLCYLNEWGVQGTVAYYTQDIVLKIHSPASLKLRQAYFSKPMEFTKVKEKLDKVIDVVLANSYHIKPHEKSNSLVLRKGLYTFAVDSLDFSYLLYPCKVRRNILRADSKFCSRYIRCLKLNRVITKNKFMAYLEFMRDLIESLDET